MPQEYDKLVRQNGEECVVEIMDEEDYRRALRRKLVEEAPEAAEAGPGQLGDELADLAEVIDALLAVEGIDRASVLAAQQRRRAERGGCVGRLRLLAVGPRYADDWPGLVSSVKVYRAPAAHALPVRDAAIGGVIPLAA